MDNNRIRIGKYSLIFSRDFNPREVSSDVVNLLKLEKKRTVLKRLSEIFNDVIRDF